MRKGLVYLCYKDLYNYYFIIYRHLYRLKPIAALLYNKPSLPSHELYGITSVQFGQIPQTLLISV